MRVHEEDAPPFHPDSTTAASVFPFLPSRRNLQPLSTLPDTGTAATHSSECVIRCALKWTPVRNHPRELCSPCFLFLSSVVTSCA